MCLKWLDSKFNSSYSRELIKRKTSKKARMSSLESASVPLASISPAFSKNTNDNRYTRSNKQ